VINQRLARLIKEAVIGLIHNFATEGDRHDFLGYYSVSTFCFLPTDDRFQFFIMG
jgi:hypothetical protein